MKINYTIIFLLWTTFLVAQTSPKDTILNRLIDLNQVTTNNEDFSGYDDLKVLLKDVEILLLGEQSHGEATTYETKIKLVKFLHEEMDFDIIAFESGFYECQKVWELMEAGEDALINFGKGVHGVWSLVNEIRPLVTYIERRLETERPLRLAGFDNQMIDPIATEYFIKDLSTYLQERNALEKYQEDLNHLTTLMEIPTKGSWKKYKKKAALKDTKFLDTLIQELSSSEKDRTTSYWIQSLISLKTFIADVKLNTYYRDQQMAANLIWLKENNPGKKIICWGATSHFLYNSKDIKMDKAIVQILGGNFYKNNLMMGHYIKEKYKNRAFTIGFVAYQGMYGYLTKPRKINIPASNTLEYIIGQSPYNNCLLPLNDLTIAPLLSRPLGNFFMKTDIATVMDAVIFNRSMQSPTSDFELYHAVYPENKYVKKIVEKRRIAASEMFP